jgi:hypothetical protein
MAARIDLTFDCADAARLAEFWKLALGYADVPPPAPLASREEWLRDLGEPGYDPSDGAWLQDPGGVGPRLCLLKVPEPKVAKNRLHMDIRISTASSPSERWAEITAEVNRLTAAGATSLREDTGHHVVMADPEGNEFCVS